MGDPHSQEAGEARRRGARIVLAVDDSRANLSILGHQLGQLGHLATLSDRGADALELISSRAFDLVLLDMVMPGLSGLDVLREVRGTRDFEDLPVIMVTARGDPEAAVEALSAGADDYLARPYSSEVLAARIARTLKRADRLAALKRANLALDARIAARAIELGEARTELAASRAERSRLIASIRSLHDQLAQVSAATIGGA